MYGLEPKTSRVAYGALGIFRVVAAGTAKYLETEFFRYFGVMNLLGVEELSTS